MSTAWLGPFSRVTGSPITKETVFHVLQNRRRRYALHHLKQREDRVPVSELAEQIAAWENDTSVQSVSTDQRRRVYISLLQTHLPTMEDADLVSVYEDANEVELTDLAEDVDIYVELVPERDIDWSEYYLGLTAFGGVFIAAAALGVYPLTELPPVAWLGFVCLLYGVSAVVHTLTHRENRLGIDGRPPE